MSTLLILGSKPDPTLPPRAAYDDVACANASGFSAAQHHLPVPVYTVMSAILTGSQSGKQSLRALRGLRTDTLCFFPRPVSERHLLKKAIHHIKTVKMKPFYLKLVLKSLAYRYDTFMNMNHQYYHTLVKELCDHNNDVLEKMERKQPSTGIIALALGIAQEKYDRYIVSGFSFELTHAYADNPEISERGTSISKHAGTDITVMKYLSQKYRVYTTEKVVHERADVPMLTENSVQTLFSTV
jgi:hypothetical protein